MLKGLCELLCNRPNVTYQSQHQVAVNSTNNISLKSLFLDRINAILTVPHVELQRSRYIT